VPCESVSVSTVPHWSKAKFKIPVESNWQFESKEAMVVAWSAASTFGLAQDLKTVIRDQQRLIISF